MKKIALLTLATLTLAVIGCRQEGGTDDHYDTQMGSSSNTNALATQRSPSATDTNGANPSTP